MGAGGQRDDTLAAYIAGLDNLIQRLAQADQGHAAAQHEGEKPMTRRKAAPKQSSEVLFPKLVLENCTDLEDVAHEFAHLEPGGTLIVTFPRDWFLAHELDVLACLPAPSAPLNVGTNPDITRRDVVGFICTRSKS
jgi:trans-aconitate methyltransferase